MTTFNARCLVGCATLAFAQIACCQDPGKLYFIHANGNGPHAFASFDLNLAMKDALEPVVLNGFSSAMSSCVDPAHGTYILCTEQELRVFDPNGQVPMQTIALPLSSGQNFGKIEYDPCLDRYLGLISPGTNSLMLAAFTPGASDFVPITTIVPSPGFVMGEQAMFDPDERLYMIKVPGRFLGIDVDNGTVVYDTPIEELVGYTPFSHLAYDCSNGRLFGTMAGPCPEGGTGKHLAQLNPSTGDVSIITEHCITSGLMKPALGGSAIDTATAVFYWSGINGTIAGTHENSGALAYDESIATGEVFFMEHFSACGCDQSTGVASGTSIPVELDVRVAHDAIFVGGIVPGQELVVMDACGRVLSINRPEGSSASIGAAQFVPGAYIISNSGRVTRLVWTR